VVEALGIAPYFRWLLVSGDADLGVRKPDPAIFRRALELAGCPPDAALYVGDSATSDVAGAASAGLRTCWLNPSGQPLPPDAPRPDWQLADLRELPAVLRQRP
jgi:FMN phosphatase YigB (HAD superfamily)